MATLIGWLDRFLDRNPVLKAAWIGTTPVALAEAVDHDGQATAR